MICRTTFLFTSKIRRASEKLKPMKKTFHNLCDARTFFGENFLITFATNHAVKEVKTARTRDFGCVIVVNM